MSITSNITGAAVNAVLGMARSASQYMPEPVASGVEFLGSLQNAQNTNEIGISSEYRELLDKQLETQQEMQQVTFTSNIEKSQHESRMAAVRNIRVG